MRLEESEFWKYLGNLRCGFVEVPDGFGWIYVYESHTSNVEAASTCNVEDHSCVGVGSIDFHFGGTGDLKNIYIFYLISWILTTLPSIWNTAMLSVAPPAKATIFPPRY
jgi:hypothetical protein